ncbi:MAG: thiamine pyrophosphate-binding protein [Halopseudomonas aestusnigri]
MTKITGGEAVYQRLKAAGIDTVFGLLGGSMLELYDALYKHGDIKYVGGRDERAAGHMADAYARVTGKPGVVLGAQAGPGVVNLVTAVAEAQLAYSPLVVIAGAIQRSDLSKDTFQEVDQVALFAPICKRSILVTDPNRLADMVDDAMRLAMSGRRGVVVLHIPRDLFAANVEAPGFKPIILAQGGAPTPEQTDAIVSKLLNAKRPLIIAGGGMKWAGGSKSLAALAEALDIPVVASTGHADVLPTSHPLNAGQGGPRGNSVASDLTRKADLLLVLGARLAFNSTFLSNEYINAEAEIVQVDVEASSIGRYFPVALGIQSDAKHTADAVLNQIKTQDIKGGNWYEWTELFKTNRRALMVERSEEAANSAVPMHPRRALGEIREALPDNAIVTLDTGNACLQAADRLKHEMTPGLITPLDFGLVGFGYAAALGAKAAYPDRPVISIMGDGAFGFTMAEVTTAIRHDLPVICVVMDNEAWGAEKAYQQTFFGGRLLGAEIKSPRYDEFARLCGARGYAVDTPGELGPILQEAIASGEAAVIHVKIDPTALNALRKDLFIKPSED